jgi:hypothetical protein
LKGAPEQKHDGCHVSRRGWPTRSAAVGAKSWPKASAVEIFKILYVLKGISIPCF